MLLGEWDFMIILVPDDLQSQKLLYLSHILYFVAMFDFSFCIVHDLWVRGGSKYIISVGVGYSDVTTIVPSQMYARIGCRCIVSNVIKPFIKFIPPISCTLFCLVQCLQQFANPIFLPTLFMPRWLFDTDILLYITVQVSGSGVNLPQSQSVCTDKHSSHLNRF